MITIETATDIALTYREIAVAEKLLEEVQQQIDNRAFSNKPDLRDAFGRHVGGLELGVPTGDSSKRLFNVAWELAKPILQAHIAQKNSQLVALNEKAYAEQKLKSMVSIGKDGE